MIAENLCMGCMKEIGAEKQCPYCGFLVDTPQITPYLPLRSVIAERYVIGKMIQSSGDGVTYMGWDYQSKTPVTIREFLPQEHVKRLFGDTAVQIQQGSELVFYDGVREFLTLWRTLARARDLSALIPVLDIVEENNTAYAISEYLETITLREFLLKSRMGYLSWDKVKVLLMPVITTLSSLHSMNIVHRGISPNTLVLGRDGKLRLTGFMISGARSLHTRYSAELFPGYAAIEQYNDVNDTGAWTDVYGFAAVAYRALTGSMPVEASERITNDKLIIPPKFADSFPAYLISALENALKIEPGDRTATIDEFREEMCGSPSMIVSSKNRETVEPATTTQDEINERKRLEKLARLEQQKQEQRKMMLITFAICVGVGLLLFGGYMLFTNYQDNKDETTTTTVVSEMVNVPNFAGQSYSRISSDEVQKTRFKFVVEYAFSSEVESGYIISQGTAEGTQVPKGSELKLVVSKGIEYITLPDVTGTDYSAAETLLTNAGFVPKKVEKNNDGTHTAGEIISTIPEAGGSYERGKEVYVQVWGPAPTTTTTAKAGIGGILSDILA